MQSDKWIKLWVKVVAFHILLGQIGINVFNFSCYCKSKIETSLMPHTQVCGSTNVLTQSCCSSKDKCHVDTHIGEKNNCGKSKTEYKKAALIGQLVEHEVHFFPFLFPPQEHVLPFIRKVDIQLSNSIYRPDQIKPSSGRFKRIRHCSLTC